MALFGIDTILKNYKVRKHSLNIAEPNEPLFNLSNAHLFYPQFSASEFQWISCQQTTFKKNVNMKFYSYSIFICNIFLSVSKKTKLWTVVLNIRINQITWIDMDRKCFIIWKYFSSYRHCYGIGNRTTQSW